MWEYQTMASIQPGSKGVTVKFHVEGMACSSCVERVDKAIRATRGVTTATVDLEAKRATVTFSGAPHTQAVIAAISAAGYEAAIEKA
jgi:copper chaperone CopZ